MQCNLIKTHRHSHVGKYANTITHKQHSRIVYRLWQRLKELPRDKNNKMACAPSKDTDQPWHPPSLIRVFAVRMKKAWVLSYPLSAQRRRWSDWADFVGFVMRQLKRWKGLLFLRWQDNDYKIIGELFLQGLHINLVLFVVYIVHV